MTIIIYTERRKPIAQLVRTQLTKSNTARRRVIVEKTRDESSRRQIPRVSIGGETQRSIVFKSQIEETNTRVEQEILEKSIIGT